MMISAPAWMAGMAASSRRIQISAGTKPIDFAASCAECAICSRQPSTTAPTSTPATTAKANGALTMASDSNEATRPPISRAGQCRHGAHEQAGAAAQRRGDPQQHDPADQRAGQGDQRRVVAARLGHAQAKEPDRQGGRRGNQPRDGRRQPLPTARGPDGRSSQPRDGNRKRAEQRPQPDPQLPHVSRPSGRAGE